MTTPTSAVSSPGHRAEDFRVDGQRQVQIGDRHYYGREWVVLAIWSADAQMKDNTSIIIQSKGLTAEPPIIWLPQDTLGLRKDAIEQTKKVCASIIVSDEKARLGESAAVRAYGEPPAPGNWSVSIAIVVLNCRRMPKIIQTTYYRLAANTIYVTRLIPPDAYYALLPSSI